MGLMVADSTPPERRSTEDAPPAFGYFASYLRDHVPECEVVYRFGVDELLAERVDLIGVSATTEEFERAKAIARCVKEASAIPVLVGGVHISVLPGNLTPQMDVAVVGEGEMTLRELLQCFVERGRRFLPEDLKRISGVAFRDEGALIRTRPRPPIQRLDELPFPDRGALQIGQPSYRTFMFTSRGCPYQCRFCASARFWPGLRYFSAEYVAREIEHIHRELGIRNIHFFDDLFITPRRRLEELCHLVEERGLNRAMSFSAAVMARLVNEDICGLLNRMNVTEVMFGAESFSKTVLDYLKCGVVRPEDNQRAIDLLHAHGIRTNVHMIYGSPVESREDLEMTFGALEENLASGKIQNVGRGTLRPYPGTPVWEEAKKRGLVSEDMNWDRIRPYPGTRMWEKARGKGLVSEDTNWERIRSFGGPYMGRIPEDEYHRMLLEHEERCMAIVPDNLALWQEWGVSRRRVATTLARRRPDLLLPFIDFNQDHREVQLGRGWYGLETSGGNQFRWMGRESVTYLAGREGLSRVSIRGSVLLEKLADRSLRVRIYIDDECLTEVSIEEATFEISVDLPASMRRCDLLELRLAAEKTFVAPPDVRELSAIVSCLGLVGVGGQSIRPLVDAHLDRGDHAVE